MDDTALEAARIDLLKDALIAEYEGRQARWHLWQGAALAAAGIASLAFAQGQLATGSMVGVSGASGLVVATSLWRLGRLEDDFEAFVEMLATDLRKLKKQHRASGGG